MQTYFALGLQINLFFINITSFMCNYLTLIPQCRKSTTDTFLTLNVYLWIPFLITLFAGDLYWYCLLYTSDAADD